MLLPLPVIGNGLNNHALIKAACKSDEDVQKHETFERKFCTYRYDCRNAFNSRGFAAPGPRWGLAPIRPLYACARYATALVVPPLKLLGPSACS